MPRKAAKSADNTAAVAAQFGISTKALRLYERLGMLTPPRTEAGWRVYGKAEIERLHAILSLKQLGLSLARIAELLKAGTTDLPALLSAQEAMLKEIRRETDHALNLVQIAKVRLSKKGDLPPDELAALVRGISRTLIRFTPELEELAERVYTPEQRTRMQAWSRDPEAAAHASDAWERIYAGIEAMLPDGDPTSKKGLDIARRAVALIRAYTQGDKELWNNSYRFWKEAVSDPRTADQAPMKSAHWEFMGKAFAELHRRGELKP